MVGGVKQTSGGSWFQLPPLVWTGRCEASLLFPSWLDFPVSQLECTVPQLSNHIGITLDSLPLHRESNDAREWIWASSMIGVHQPGTGRGRGSAPHAPGFVGRGPAAQSKPSQLRLFHLHCMPVVTCPCTTPQQGTGHRTGFGATLDQSKGCPFGYERVVFTVLLAFIIGVWWCRCSLSSFFSLKVPSASNQFTIFGSRRPIHLWKEGCHPVVAESIARTAPHWRQQHLEDDELS